MQPPVVKYQAKKETRVTKNKLCKMYSDIKKMWITETKFHDFSMKMSFFLNSMIFPCIEFFLDHISSFPGEWEPCYMHLEILINMFIPNRVSKGNYFFNNKFHF